LKLWDITTKSCVQTFRAHSADCLNVDVLSDGQTFLSWGVDKTVLIWDVRAENPVRKWENMHTADVPCAKINFFESEFVTTSDDATARIFDLGSENKAPRLECLLSHRETNTGATDAAFSLNSDCIYVASSDHMAEMFEIQHGKSIGSLPHENRVSRLVVSPDGRFVATASWDTIIKTWK